MAINNPPTLISNRLALFPDSTRIQEDCLSIGGVSLQSLAAEFGTPLYIYDVATMDAAVEAYRQALKDHYPAAANLTHAGKSFLCKAVARWTLNHDLWIDCTGEGEMAIALAGKVPRANLLVHGVNKSPADLAFAFQHAGTVVVDNLTELQRIREWIGRPMPDLWLRLLPGVAVQTHHVHTQTGQQDSKFGMTPEELVQAAGICRSLHLPLKGLHFHLGSHFRDPSPLVEAIELALELVRELGFSEEWHFSPGGGWAVAYHEDELPQPDIETYVRVIAQGVLKACRSGNLPLPVLHIEPGRSLVARAGVALYRVGAVKRRGERTWLLVDGGMTDNPRFALYGAKYSCLPVTGLDRTVGGRVHIGGPYCESGDILIEDLPMPEMREDELIAIPVSGAYQLSMANNYNGSRRPAVVWIQGGQASLIRRRETVEDLMKCDI